MCTALNSRTCFGRNLDVDFSFREEVVITPRRFLFRLKNGSEYRTRYGLIGTAAVVEGTPLYYEVCNEKGLCMAGLNFPESARYAQPEAGRDNITVSELLPWIVGQSGDLGEARQLLERLNLTGIPFGPELPPSPMHFLLGDGSGSLVLEPTGEGLKVYENPYDTLTNEPPFPYHLWNLRNYRHLGRENGDNRFSGSYPLEAYAVGMGAGGLPGDCSSASRFVRAAFHLANSRWSGASGADTAQFFHVLDAVAMPKGSVVTKSGKDDITLYSCCYHRGEHTYYYKTAENSRLTAVKLTEAMLTGDSLTRYPLRREPDILYEN